jgi:RHS repeat-associated protein
LSPGHSVTYAWDARGNLVADGTFTYTYNAAGRLVRAASVTATLVYTYNAAGLRVAQAVEGDETTFTWDWATGVPELLSDGDVLYLVGHETLGQFADDAWTYYLPDALGSVRHETDADAAVVAAREWTPYGVEIGGAQAGLGFTGEWFDANVGLQYLRARWYAVEVGRFTSRDPWEGDNKQPQTHHAYVYVQGNPVNAVDPSGCTPQMRYRGNPYDLSLWLQDELHTNANSHYISRIRTLWMSNDPIDSSLNKLRALAAFNFLVKDRAKWDFKHRILRYLRIEKNEGIILRHRGEPHWYEYSVPGNMHFGFVGRAAGFSGLLLHTGAGWAEVRDPAHKQEGEACCPAFCRNEGLTLTLELYEPCVIRLGCYYVNPDWVTSLFDDPQDYSSVEWGVQLYNRYSRHLSYRQFQDYLTLRGTDLTPAPTIPKQDWTHPDWPFERGYFNGPDDAKNERWVKILLANW